LQLEPHTRDFSYLRHLFVYYRALQHLGLPVDVVSPASSFTPYSLLIAPSAHLADSALAQKLTDYVRGSSASSGQALLLGVRSGFKTPTNTVTTEPLPGVLRDLIGATVTDWGALPAGVGFELESAIPGLQGQATLWTESLVTLSNPSASLRTGLQSLVTYRSGPYAGRAALTENRLPLLPSGEGVASSMGMRPDSPLPLGEGVASLMGVRGRVWYCGWFPTLDQATALLRHVANELSLSRLADDLPHGLLAARRGAHTALLNFTDEPLTGQVGGRSITVAGRDVAIA
jgi:hypothetical protein